MADSDRGGKSDEALAALLAGGASVRAAARKTGLSERTIYRRQTRTGFAALVQQLRQEMLRQAASRLVRMTGKAVHKLNQLLDSSDERVSLQACKLVVEAALKVGERVELEARIAALEKRQAEQDRRKDHVS